MVDIERSKRKKTTWGILNVWFNLDNLSQQLDVAWKEDRDWKSAWKQAMREQKEIKEGLEAHILDFKRFIKESQVVVSKEHRLRVEDERSLPANWREMYKEIQILKEHGYQQRQNHEVLSI